MNCSVCKKVHVDRYACCTACRRNSRTWKSRHWMRNLLCTHRNRDIKSGIYDPQNFCTLEHIKTVRRELNDHCYHCNIPLDVEHRNQPDGLTLQRLNNMIGHTCPNTTIACLSCNRRRVESCNTGWLAQRRAQVIFDELVAGGYQLLTRRMNKYAV